MSRRIEIYPAPWGKVRMETWVNGRCMGISEAISHEDALSRAEALPGATDDIVDHTQHEFKRPDKNTKFGFR